MATTQQIDFYKKNTQHTNTIQNNSLFLDLNNCVNARFNFGGL